VKEQQTTEATEDEPVTPSEEPQSIQTEPQPNQPIRPKIITVPVEVDKEVSKKLGVTKTATIKKDNTKFDITLTPKKDLHKVQVTEEIPLEVATKASEIIANTPFKVLKEATTENGLTIRFDLSDLKKDQTRTITYEINKELLTEFVFRPTTFLLLEEAINPGALWFIRILFSIALILLACAIYLSKVTHRKHHYWIHLALFCLCILVFVLFNIKVEIVISETTNNIIVGSGLSIAVIVLLATNIKYLLIKRTLSSEEQEIEDLEL